VGDGAEVIEGLGSGGGEVGVRVGGLFVGAAKRPVGAAVGALVGEAATTVGVGVGPSSPFCEEVIKVQADKAKAKKINSPSFIRIKYLAFILAPGEF
jgi:hypothetical protein